MTTTTAVATTNATANANAMVNGTVNTAENMTANPIAMDGKSAENEWKKGVKQLDGKRKKEKGRRNKGNGTRQTERRPECRVRNSNNNSDNNRNNRNSNGNNSDFESKEMFHRIIANFNEFFYRILYMQNSEIADFFILRKKIDLQKMIPFLHWKSCDHTQENGEEPRAISTWDGKESV